MAVAGCSHSGTYVMKDGQKFLPKEARTLLINKLPEIDTVRTAGKIKTVLLDSLKANEKRVQITEGAYGTKIGRNKEGNGILTYITPTGYKPVENAIEFDGNGNKIKAELYNIDKTTDTYSMGTDKTTAIEREKGIPVSIQVDESSIFNAKTGNQIFQ